MNRIYLLGFTFSCLLSAGLARAQHVDILLWDDGGQIGVGQFDYDSLTTTVTRVHLARFDSFYSVNQPGFSALPGSDALPGGKDLEWDFLPMTIDTGPHAGYESTLLYWDGVGSTPEFGPTPTGDYEFSLYGQNGRAIAGSGNQVVPGGLIATTPPNGSLHIHHYYLLDDNGDELNTTLPQTGIYLVGMRAKMDGLEDSEPFFMVWATPEQEILSAIWPASQWVNQRVDSLVIERPEGDYNDDGMVDAADYTVWRDSYGLTGSALAADGNGDEVVDAADYAVWQNNYTSAATPVSASLSVTAPEPSSVVVLSAYLIGVGGVPRRRGS